MGGHKLPVLKTLHGVIKQPVHQKYTQLQTHRHLSDEEVFQTLQIQEQTIRAFNELCAVYSTEIYYRLSKPVKTLNSDWLEDADSLFMSKNC